MNIGSNIFLTIVLATLCPMNFNSGNYRRRLRLISMESLRKSCKHCTYSYIKCGSIYCSILAYEIIFSYTLDCSGYDHKLVKEDLL